MGGAHPIRRVPQDGQRHERKPGFLVVMAALGLVSIPGKCGAMFGWAEEREFLAASQCTTASPGFHAEDSAVIVYGWGVAQFSCQF